MATLSAELRDDTNTALLSPLSGARARKCRAVKNAAGTGSLVLDLDDSARAAMTRNRVVRFLLDGTPVWAGLVRRPRVTLRARGEESEEGAEYPLVGVLQLFDEVRVEPELGVGKVSPKQRRFDGASKYYDDSAWGAAVQLKQQSSITGQWDAAPDGFPNPAAFWIWTRGQVDTGLDERNGAVWAHAAAQDAWNGVVTAHAAAVAADTAPKWSTAAGAAGAYKTAAQNAANAYAAAAAQATAAGDTSYSAAASDAASAWSACVTSATNYQSAANAAAAAVGGAGYAAAEAAAISAYGTAEGNVTFADAESDTADGTDYNGQPAQPVGSVYFRRTFTLADEALVGFFFSADDGRELVLDGEVIDADLQAFAWGNTYQALRFLSAGDHVVFVRAENMAREKIQTNVAGFICSAHLMDAGGKTPSTTPLFATSAAWKALDYPAAPPAMTPGHIVRVLVEEAQARGALAGLTLDFTDSADSNGAPWATPVDVIVQVADTYRSVLDQLVETSVDLRMSPTGLELQMFNKGTMGGSSGAAWSVDEHIEGVQFDGEDATGTAMLTQDERGVWAWRTAATLGIVGRIETAAELGAAPSDTQAERVADAAFSQIATPRDHATADIRPASAIPLVDVNVGDTVTLVDVDGNTQAAELDAITVAEDTTARAVFTVEYVA